MQPSRDAHLVQNKLRKVLSGYGSAMEAGEIRKRPDRVAAGLIVEDGWPDENPVESGISDDRLLAVLVRVHLSQEKRE